MSDLLALRVELPPWIAGFRAALPACLETPEQRMEVAIDLSRQNVLAGSGGPFGALVVAEDSGEVVALGVNRVEPGSCSSAHAEIVALSMAQRLAADWNLGRHPAAPLQLVSSCEPCAMCLGAIPWSGVASVLCGATKADAEAAGFDEGDRPDEWMEKMAARGIRVHIGLMRAEAAAVLDLYARSGKTIYGPDSRVAGK
ncbi:MAG: nucleoside deaminase [Wenzhouxiangella sp.]|nr:nucleoside deaminase [Wenzhouxiangella sp.]MCH8478786.1 nucleoside deaminase [Wenzhouxiangella sp.]TVR98683.1 MAG: nucleoside deaminase [Wenzhouxiangellaceae bacterium]